jgi:hypothetical protein
MLLDLLRLSLGRCAPGAVSRMSFDMTDWQAVLSMAVRNGVAPLLHCGLGDARDVPIPGHVASGLATEFFENAALHLLHETALDRLGLLFQRKGIPFVVLKGVGLGALLYPQPEWRPCGGDIDILVQNADYGRARSALLEIGYEPDDPISERHELTYTGEAEFSTSMGGTKIIVDLHTDFNANSWGKVSGFDMEGFWEDRFFMEHHGIRMPFLPADAHLVFLAIHLAANHVFDRLINFCDLDLLVRKFARDIDWRHIAGYVRSRGGGKALYFALSYTRRLLGTPIPAWFLEALKPGPFSRALVPARHLLLRGEPPPKAMHRYIHVVLLDDPRLMQKSLRFFVRRFLSERAVKRRKRSSLNYPR